MKRGKKYKKSFAQTGERKPVTLPEALVLLRRFEKAKFEETVEVAIKLAVDPRHSDQQIRGSFSLPHGTGKDVRVIAFAEGEKADAARAAGAMEAGGEELAKKIEQGWTDFDVAIASPDMMRVVGKLGRILGPKGLMPSPKVGTVTPDVAKAVEEFRKGKIEYRTDNTGNIHAPVGKRSFSNDKLRKNIEALIEEIRNARPISLKGRDYIRSVNICATMTPGVAVALES